MVATRTAMSRSSLLLVFPALLSVARAWVPSSPKNFFLPHGGFQRVAVDVQDCKRDLDQVFQSCQRHIIGTAFAAALVLLPPHNSYLDSPLLPPAFAEETSVVSVPQSTSIKGEDVVDEAWNLVHKYFIDQTYNGQDWKQVKQKYEVLARGSDPTTVQRLVTEMVASLGDKYSRVLDPAAYAAIQKYDLIGVGVTLMPNENKDIIVGAPPIPGSASAKAGLQVGDQVTAINGISNKGRTAFDIIDQIGDNPNAETVTMSVKKSGSSESVDYVLVRQFQQVKNPIKYKISERRPDGTVVGYVRVSEFNALVKARLEDALRDLKSQGANAYVFDVRQNVGGAFQSAVEVSSFFFSDRVATYVVDNSDSRLPFRTSKDKVIIDPDSPVVMWIDDRSASATEVLAGSLHDNCRAVLQGNKSFGKGLIQAVYGLKNGAGLVLTVARYVTPSGTDIQGIGITPDLPGQGVPLPIPGLMSDTSKVDFGEIKKRLDPSFCTLPTEIGN